MPTRVVHALLHRFKQSALFRTLLFSKRTGRPRLWWRLLIRLFQPGARKAWIHPAARLDLLPYYRFSAGPGTRIEESSLLNNGAGPVSIGARGLIGVRSVVVGPVTLGNDVLIAQHVVISGVNHLLASPLDPSQRQRCSMAQITIGDHVWIGANSVVTAGVTIGTGAVIGAGAVVTRDVPAWSVAVGNPARVVRVYNPDTATWDRQPPANSSAS